VRHPPGVAASDDKKLTARDAAVGPEARAIEAGDQARLAQRRDGAEVRVVDQKTAVVPLHADTLADPNKLLASIRSLVDLA